MSSSESPSSQTPSEADPADTNSAETPSRPRLYLVDGFSNIFRAFYAIRNLSSSEGEPTNAVFGFLQMLRKLLRDENPEYLGIAMDVSSATIRKEKYEDYKANRKPMPEDLRPQIPWIRRLIETYHIPILEMPGYEADDVLGTLAHKAVAEGFEVVLVSPDKDLMQLVGDGVFLYHTGRDKLYDPEGVAADFGVPPHQVVDVLSLMGDASDNVPGVPGIGEKGAKNLIAEHGSLDALLEAAATVKRKSYREGLEQHRDKAMLSKELVTIHTDLDVEFDPRSLTLDEPDWDALLELCWRLDFQALAKEIEASHGAVAAPLEDAVEITTVEELHSLATRLEASEGRVDLALAVLGDEADSHGRALGLALACPQAEGLGGASAEEDSNGEDSKGASNAPDKNAPDTSDEDGEDPPAIYLDFRRPDLKQATLEQLATWAADPDLRLVGHHLKEVLRLLGPRAEIRCRLFDVMLASYVAHSALRGHDFEAVAMDRLQRSCLAAKDAGFLRGDEPMLGDARLAAFAAERVLLPWRMAPALEDDLERQDLTTVYETLEEPLVSVLATVEETGVLVDVDFLQQMSGELATEIEATQKEIYDIAGEKFNVASPKQLGEVMFEKLGYPVLRKTRKTRSYSTSADTLEELANRGYDLPDRILKFRELTKLKSTYVDVLPVLVADDARVHTRFNQAVAQTGRLSSANPNLQNIPVRTELGQRIRKAFRAAEGHTLVVADYSQVELRVLAHMADEEVMIEAFRQGDDIHSATAAAVFGGSPMLVVPEQRRMAKVINFGIIYGMSSFGLASRLGIPKKDAQTFIDTYMERYPGVRRYTESILDEAFEHGEVRTLYGRVRQLPDIRSRNFNLRENAKRMAINAPIQGTAADLLKLAMVAVEERLRREMPAARLLLTVHDELVLEGPESEAEALGELVRQEMSGVAELQVPLVVDVGMGVTWYDAKG